MAVLFVLAAGPAERDTLLDMAGTATALLALGDRLAVIEADDAVAAELVNQSGVVAAVDAVAALGPASAVEALIDDPAAAVAAVSELLAVDQASIDDGVVGEALAWLTSISPSFVAETSSPAGDGEPWNFAGPCETTAQLPPEPPPPESPLRAARFSGDDVLAQCLLGEHRMQAPEQGRAVLKVQAALLDLGFALPTRGADGVFGDETGQAVTAFKQANGIEPSDPVVGPRTMARLDELLA